VKIDRAKLNTLLRSGLNPEIKTRKHLAAHLSLDPTSLTRWFASRDRLGNPRYPVVPDRHVTKILKLFNLDPDSLNLNEDEFHQYCFEQSLLQSNHQSDLEQKNKQRLENASNRKLNISDYSTNKGNRTSLVMICSAILVAISCYFIYGYYFNDTQLLTNDKNNTLKTEQCWTGYSESLGRFDYEDEADPCHYAKLFHNALTQLKSDNLSIETNEPSVTQSYITFLFEKLEHRRIMDNIILHIELGKSEFNRSNYQTAESYFNTASEMIMTLPEENVQILAEISFYMSKTNTQSN